MADFYPQRMSDSTGRSLAAYQVKENNGGQEPQEPQSGGGEVLAMTQRPSSVLDDDFNGKKYGGIHIFCLLI